LNWISELKEKEIYTAGRMFNYNGNITFKITGELVRLKVSILKTFEIN
jgi:hypothetical protein